MEDNIQNNITDNSEIDKIRAEVEDVKKQRDEYLNGWKRAKADFLNYQKDEMKRLDDMGRLSMEAILEDAISVLDGFNHGLVSIEKSGGQVDKGLYLVKNQLEDLLKRRGVTQTKVGPGEAYNPMYHEAIQMLEEATVDGKKIESGHIAEVVEAGYAMDGKVLKPARVKVVQ